MAYMSSADSLLWSIPPLYLIMCDMFWEKGGGTLNKLERKLCRPWSAVSDVSFTPKSYLLVL